MAHSLYFFLGTHWRIFVKILEYNCKTLISNLLVRQIFIKFEIEGASEVSRNVKIGENHVTIKGARNEPYVQLHAYFR